MGSGKFFAFLVGLSALCIAGSAAFFSVFGLSKLFAGATKEVIVMAGSLEFGKLISASFLYRYWDKVNKALRTYLLVGIITLVGITSAGIFGFLSNAYQGATIEFEKESTKLLYKEDRLSQLEEDKIYLKDELEIAISELPDNYITAKRQLRADYNPKVLEINDQILGVKAEIGNLKTALVETGVDVGPAIYLARVFGTDIDTVVKFFIFILIFVFDPMAVVLVICYNVVLLDRQGKNYKPKIEHSGRKWWQMYGENKPIKEKIKEAVLKKEEPTARKTQVHASGGKADARIRTEIEDE
jgi:hypothetical protein